MDKQKIMVQRNHYINNLQQFLSSSKQTLQEIVHNLGWSTEKTVYKVILHTRPRLGGYLYQYYFH